ncbi:MAG: rhodanese-like domain-containing protein [Bacteroidales bacterium]
MNKWFPAGFFSHGVHNLTPGDSFALCEKGAIIFDVREDYLSAFKMFKADKVVYLPLSKLEEHYKELPDDKPLVFADTVGLRSREGVVFMNSHGYDNVANMAGGIVDWERDGLPLNTDISNRLSGSCLCQLKPREWKKQKNSQ